MDLKFTAGRWVTGSRRRGLVPVFAGMLAVLTLAIAAPAQATPNTAKTWGADSFGQLGNGKTEDSDVPVAVTGLSGVTAMAGGQDFSLALLENGTVMAWGSDGEGQLGNGKTEGESVAPVAVSGLSGVTGVAAGSYHGLALLGNGEVMAWGGNGSGQLGNGTTTSSDVPVAVSGLAGVTAVAAGESHSLALLSNGTVVAWGGNYHGQLGNGTTTSSDVPVAVSGLSGVVAIAAGGEHSLALLSNGTVMAWGDDIAGDLGDGSETQSDIPVAVSKLTGATEIAAGGGQSLALLEDGTVMAWGDNADGQLGDGSKTGPETCGLPPTTPCAKTPTSVSGLTDVSALAAGGSQSVALLSDGAVMDWGANNSGQLGDGTETGPEIECEGHVACSRSPIEVSKMSGARGIAAGNEFSLAFGPPPTVAGVHLLHKKHGHAHGPASGGTTVTITGLDFAGVSAVKFGSTEATSFTVNSPTSITAVSPPVAIAGKHRSITVDVTVTNGWGPSATTEADHFKYRR